ncbi:alpha/beta hydrolase [Promicromonospora sp. MEB111]|uniref:RBBP9/YdeN family alpha/beta hydrolase n=1 Tax=Promicromonospora sp. MEB111 TaxID=3040301 RepID=UPI002549EA23|nr:alpha/beta hydrolase [Promicromonospora sp. MEB111]
MRYVTVPGYGGSGVEHWQTHWERDLPATRFRPASWDTPDARDWADALDRVVADGEGPVVLLAHSLGCLAVASWLAEVPRRDGRGSGGRRRDGREPGEVAGALLVAVPDPAGPAFPAGATAGGFRAVRRRLPVPVTVVVSDDDPYASPAWVRGLAAVWGAEAVGIGPAGHVNGASGLGVWPAGREILRHLVRPRPPASATSAAATSATADTANAVV